MSTTFVDGAYIAPEDRLRPALKVDYEGGPIAITNTSGGMNYQPWSLAYTDPVITLIPEITGVPVVVLNVSDCEQLSFCFDQNARVSITYIKGTSMFLYWYDSVAADFVTTEFTNVVSSLLSMDDKRLMEAGNNDMLLWYTILSAPAEYTLYHRKQRDRFLTPHLMRVDTLPYMSRGGMHVGLRGKIATRASVG